MLRQCEHTDTVSEVSGSLFLHHLGLIKRFMTCEKKKGLMIYPTQTESTRFFIERKF